MNLVFFLMKKLNNILHNWFQGRNEVRGRPVPEASLAPSCSNLRSFGSKCTGLKEVLVTLLGVFGAPYWLGARETAPLLPPSLHPWVGITSFSKCTKYKLENRDAEERGHDWRGVAFHNSIIGDSLVDQDRIEANLLQPEVDSRELL